MLSCDGRVCVGGWCSSSGKWGPTQLLCWAGRATASSSICPPALLVVPLFLSLNLVTITWLTSVRDMHYGRFVCLYYCIWRVTPPHLAVWAICYNPDVDSCWTHWILPIVHKLYKIFLCFFQACLSLTPNFLYESFTILYSFVFHVCISNSVAFDLKGRAKHSSNTCWKASFKVLTSGNWICDMHVSQGDHVMLITNGFYVLHLKVMTWGC